jgi:hypothetical protein
MRERRERVVFCLEWSCLLDRPAHLHQQQRQYRVRPWFGLTSRLQLVIERANPVGEIGHDVAQMRDLLANLLDAGGRIRCLRTRLGFGGSEPLLQLLQLGFLRRDCIFDFAIPTTRRLDLVDALSKRAHLRFRRVEVSIRQCRLEATEAALQIAHRRSEAIERRHSL